MTETSEIWTGKASSYNRVRPTPPPALLDLLTQLIGMPHPALVVDVGSGTGLSTAIWGERAERVIGIEPNADMRKEATHNVEDHPYAGHIEYREGLAHQTGLPDGCADIVTAAQSFHFTREVLLHHIEQGDTEQEIGFDRLRQSASGSSECGDGTKQAHRALPAWRAFLFSFLECISLRNPWTLPTHRAKSWAAAQYGTLRHPQPMTFLAIR